MTIAAPAGRLFLCLHYPLGNGDILEPDVLRTLVVPDELSHPAGGSRLPSIDSGLIPDLQISKIDDALPGAYGAQAPYQVRTVDLLAAVTTAPITGHCGKLPSEQGRQRAGWC